VAVAVWLLAAAAYAQAESWEHPPSSEQYPRIWSLPTVPSASIYEVAPTRLMTATVNYLTKVPFTEISCDLATHLTSGHFSFQPRKKPFLVRAAYVHETGRFTIHYDGSTLFVHHGSLGHSSPPARNLPLIINLPFTPTEVFVSVSVAE